MAKREFAKIVELLKELLWTGQVYRKKLRKSHDYNRSFLKKNITRVEYRFFVCLSQSAPGLECGCRRVGYGRGHGCTAKLTKRYFGF